MLITHSGTSSTFSSVCLMVLLRTRREGEKITMGGVEENRLKKLKGLRFTFPALSIVLAKQIGRGAMAYCRYWCRVGVFSWFKSMIIIERLSRVIFSSGPI